MHKMQQTAIRADRDRQDTRRPEVLRPEVRANGIPGGATKPGQAIAGHDDRPTPDGVASVTPDTVCLICGSPGHTSSSCQSEAAKALREKPVHTSRARIWPFGPGYISQLAPHYGKPDQRGQHMAGNGKPVTVVQNGKAAHQHRARDTSKFAPKHPKAGKPPPGNRAPKGAA